MQWATAVSREVFLEDAVQECAEEVRGSLGPGPVTLALAFITPHFAMSYNRLYKVLNGALAPETLLGCSAGGVIGGGEEVERCPAISLVAARLPDVTVHPFNVTEPLPDPDGPPGLWEDLVGVGRGEEPRFVILADPFTARPEPLLAGLDYAFPGSPKVGGLASGGTSPGQNALFLDGEVTSGVVGVALSGNVVVDTVVAQGCRPVGDLMRITSCEANVVHELDDQPAFAALKELLAELDEGDQRLARTSLFVGMVMDEFEEEPKAGDFLIRNLVGADPEAGAIAVGEYLQEGTRLQFHLRDAETSADDLNAVLDGYTETLSWESPISGALLFSCLGRGEYLYGEPNFDTGVFGRHLGPVPVGGFFCNGEIGPVGGATFLHGYTSSFGIFRPREQRQV